MNDVFKYPAIKPSQLSPDQKITGYNGKQISTIIDYWKWAHSDLLGNTERGILAEFLVRLALGINDNRLSWDKYDLLYKEHIKIEVKSSAYIQTWGQKELSSIRFNISPSFGWDAETNSYEEIKKRQSDLYVFCLLACKDQNVINPTDAAQWIFYVLPTKSLDEHKSMSKTISLSALKKLPVTVCHFNELKYAIDRLSFNE